MVDHGSPQMTHERVSDGSTNDGHEKWSAYPIGHNIGGGCIVLIHHVQQEDHQVHSATRDGQQLKRMCTYNRNPWHVIVWPQSKQNTNTLPHQSKHYYQCIITSYIILKHDTDTSLYQSEAIIPMHYHVNPIHTCI